MNADRGSASVEFVLLLPVFLAALVLLAEVVSVGRLQIELVGAAREGARVAATDPAPTSAISAARSALAPTVADVAAVSVSRPAVVGAAATVEVRMPYRAADWLLGGLEVELRGRATMRVER